MSTDHPDIPDEEAVPLEIDGVLDLHMFPPNQVKDLVTDWLVECRKAGLTEVRIIHGKGIGALRETVYSILKRDPTVESYAHPTDVSSWGATLVRFKSEVE